MSDKLSNYYFDDLEIPLLVNKVFDKKVNAQFMRDTQPDVRPADVFDGYKKTPKKTGSKPKKTVRRSKRIKKVKKKDDDKVSDN